MKRIFLENFEIGKKNPLSNEIFHYLFNVLRLKEGDQVLVFNNIQGEFLANVIFLKKSSKNISAFLEPIEKTRDSIKNKFKIFLVFSPLKPHRNSFLLEKSTEIGVTDFIPLITERTQFSINYEKLKRVIIEASEQSERISVPTIHKTQKFHDFLCTLPSDTKWFAGIERVSLPTLLNSLIIEKSKKEENYGIIIGPEGGFSEKEKEYILKSPILSVSLGEQILRSETAAIYALSCISSALFYNKDNNIKC